MTHFEGRVRRTLVVLGVVVACASTLARAQQPAAQAEDEAAQRGEAQSQAEEWLARVNAASASIDALRARVATAEGKAREILQPTLEDERVRYRRLLGDATEALGGEEPLEGSDAERQALATTLRARLSSEMQHVRTDLRHEGERLRDTVAQLETATGDARRALTAERDASVERTGDRVGEASALLKAREQLGEDLTSDRRWLEAHLNSSATFVTGALQTTAQTLERLEAVDGPDAALQQRMQDLRAGRRLLADLQHQNLALMEELGLDTVELRRDLIRSTGEISGGVLDRDVLGGLLRDLRGDAGDWLSENASGLLVHAASFVLILLLAGFVARAARWLTRRGMARSNASNLARDFAVASAGRLVLAVGFMVAFAQLGVEIGPLLAGLGIAGFVVGFALQDTLANFASGMMILAYRPFDVGDVVEAGGVSGSVRAMSLVTTSIVTFDNQMLVVPNNKIWGSVIRNVTHQAERRVDLTFGAGYDADVAKVEAVLKDIVESHPRVLADPPPLVRLHALGDSSVDFVVRPWVKTADYWDTYWEITREVKLRFDAEGISIPFPQRDLHVYEERVARRPPAVSDVAPAPRARESTDDRAHDSDTAEG